MESRPAGLSESSWYFLGTGIPVFRQGRSISIDLDRSRPISTDLDRSLSNHRVPRRSHHIPKFGDASPNPITLTSTLAEAIGHPPRTQANDSIEPGTSRASAIACCHWGTCSTCTKRIAFAQKVTRTWFVHQNASFTAVARLPPYSKFDLCTSPAIAARPSHLPNVPTGAGHARNARPVTRSPDGKPVPM